MTLIRKGSSESPSSLVIPPQQAKSGLVGDPGNRHDRKGKTLPLINTDDTDQEYCPEVPKLPNIAEIERQNQTFNHERESGVDNLRLQGEVEVSG